MKTQQNSDTYMDMLARQYSAHNPIEVQRKLAELYTKAKTKPIK